MFLTLSGVAQYPLKVEKIMYDSAKLSKPIDTVKFENYWYVFNVKGDSSFMRWELIKKDRLYFDGFKAAGVAYFCMNMAAFVVLPQTGLHKDKYLHFGAGYIAGSATNLIVYKLSKKKWLSMLAGLAAGAALGFAKEYIYDKNFGGVVSWKDAAWTCIGTADGAAAITIVIGHKQLLKKHLLD